MDKISRRMHILERGGAGRVADESVMDSLVDEINYLAIEAGLLIEAGGQGDPLSDLMDAAHRLPSMLARMLHDDEEPVVRRRHAHAIEGE